MTAGKKLAQTVDWSDKLKHMEMKDILDIDLGNQDDTFTHYLE